MIFGGWGRKTKERGQVIFLCTNDSCRQLQAFGLLENYGYGQVYGVRVAKISTERFMACTRCQRGYELTKAQWDYARQLAAGLDALPTIEDGDIRASVLALAQLLEPESVSAIDEFLLAHLDEPERRGVGVLPPPIDGAQRSRGSSAHDPFSLMSGSAPQPSPSPTKAANPSGRLPENPESDLRKVMGLAPAMTPQSIAAQGRLPSGGGLPAASLMSGRAGGGGERDGPQTQETDTAAVTASAPAGEGEAGREEGLGDETEIDHGAGERLSPAPPPRVVDDLVHEAAEDRGPDRRALRRLLREALEERGLDYEVHGDNTWVAGRLVLAASGSAIECYTRLDQPAASATSLIAENAHLPGAAFLATYESEGAGLVLAAFGRLPLPDPIPQPELCGPFVEALCDEVLSLAAFVEGGGLAEAT